MENVNKKKNSLKKPLIDALKYIVLSVGIIGLVYLFSPSKAGEMNHVVVTTLSKILTIMLGVILLIGLLQVWLTPKQISKLIGHESGVKGMLIASIFPIVLGGSMITIFPLLVALRDKGVPNRIIITFIVAWAGKAPLIPLEIEFLGIKFAILRIVLIIPLALLLGLLGEKILIRLEGYKTLPVLD